MAPLNVCTQLWHTEMLFTWPWLWDMCFWLLWESFSCCLTIYRHWSYRKANQQMNQWWHNDGWLPCFKSILNHMVTWSWFTVLLEQDYPYPYSHSGDKRSDQAKWNFQDIEKHTRDKLDHFYESCTHTHTHHVCQLGVYVSTAPIKVILLISYLISDAGSDVT